MQLILLFLSAFFVRLVNLNQSLWLDESIVARVAKNIPFHLIPTQLSPGDVHPPLYYMVVSLWSSLFGYSEISLRMPSIIFSLIAGWYIYKIGIAIKNKTLGLWAAAFFLFNPLVIYYSQEARMHMMATTLLSIALYYFILLIKEFEILNFKFKNIFFFNLFSAIAMCTFYGSGFFIAGLIVTFGFLRLKKKGKIKGWIPAFAGMTQMSIGLIFSLLLLSPLLLQQLANAKAGLADLKNWSMALGKAEIKNVAMIFLKFATGRLSWLPKWSYYLVAGIPTAIIWLFVALGARRNKLFVYLFILPLLFGIFVSFWAPMMMYFRFLYLVPVMSLLLALGVVMNEKNKVLPSFVLGMMLFFSFIYLFIPQFHREDWKSMSSKLQTNVPVYMILPSSDPVLYYRNDVSIRELRTIKKSSIPEIIHVVPYTSEIYGLNYVKSLEDLGCIKESQASFRGDVVLEKWKCLRNA